MNTRPVDTLTAVAVIAKYLKARWKVIDAEPSVEVMNGFAMCSPTSIDMINSQEFKCCFLAASAAPSVSRNALSSQGVTFGLSSSNQL